MDGRSNTDTAHTKHKAHPRRDAELEQEQEKGSCTCLHNVYFSPVVMMRACVRAGGRAGVHLPCRLWLALALALATCTSGLGSMELSTSARPLNLEPC
jgi:hypothetical protein